MTLIVLLLSASFLLWHPSPAWAAIKAYSCNKPEISQIVSLHDTKNCAYLDTPPEMIRLGTKTVNILQRNDLKVVSVLQCTCTQKSVAFHCGQSSHSSYIFNEKFENSCDSIEGWCQKLHATNQFFYRHNLVRQMTKNKRYYITITTGGSVFSNDGSCTGSGSFNHRGREYKGILVNQFRISYTNSEIHWNPVNNQILESRYAHCDITKSRNCTSLDGRHQILFIQPYKDILQSCDFYKTQDAKFTIYALNDLTAPRNKINTNIHSLQNKMILSQNKQKMLRFVITTQAEKHCQHDLYPTQIPDVYVAYHAPHFKPPTILPAQPNSFLNTYALIDYTRFSINKNLKALYSTYQTNLCKIRALILQNRLNIFRSLRHDDLMLISKNPVLFARQRGATAVFLKCNEYDISLRPTPGKCFRDVPIFQHTSTFKVARFLDPTNRLILNDSIATECNKIMPLMFQLSNSTWLSYSGEFHRVNSPEAYPINFEKADLQFSNITDYREAGLYSYDDIKAFQHFLQRGRSEKYLSVHRNNLNLPGRMSELEILVSEDSITNRIKQSLSRISLFFRISGAYFGAFLLVVYSLMVLKLLILKLIDFMALRQFYTCTGACLRTMIPCFARYVLLTGRTRQHQRPPTASDHVYEDSNFGGNGLALQELGLPDVNNNDENSQDNPPPALPEQRRHQPLPPAPISPNSARRNYVQIRLPATTTRNTPTIHRRTQPRITIHRATQSTSALRREDETLNVAPISDSR